MTVLQTVNLSTDAVKMRWKEPYVTAGLNQKDVVSQPKGVLTGFGVVPNGGFVVNVQLDPTLTLSVANVLETTGGLFSVTIVQNTNIFIDLTAQAGTTCFIALDAQYAVGSASAAQVKVVDAAELVTNLDLVLLAKVNVPGVGPVLASHINLGYRDVVGDAESSGAAPPFNLIRNSNFEAATASGWTNGGLDAVVASTDTAHTGSYSLKLTKAVAGSVNVLTGPMPVTPGDSYRAAAWVRSTGGAPITGGNGAKFQINWYDAAGVQIGASIDIEAAFTGGGTTWEERKASVVAPALALTARALVFYDNCSGTLYVDDVEFSTRRPDMVMTSAVFGGADSVADDWHKHSALGLTYAGSAPNNWADGSSIPAGSIESGIDAVPTALGSAAGASKVGFTPTTPVDLTAVRVDTALNELDDKKASLAKNNVFANTVVDTTSIAATGNGTGSGVTGTGGATAGSIGVIGTGGAGGGVGVQGIGTGAAGGGGVFQTSATASGGTAAVTGTATNTNGAGVAGTGTGTGPGVAGIGASTGAGVTGRGAGATTGATAGEGVLGFGGVTAPGVRGTSGGTGPAVKGDGNFAGNTGIGVEGQGGGASPGVKGTGGTGRGVLGVGGTGIGASGVRGEGSSNVLGGPGVEGQGTVSGSGGIFIGGATGPTSGSTLADGAGAIGIGGAAGEGNGVYGQGGSASNVGVTSLSFKNTGVVGIGSGAGGAGVIGISAAVSGGGIHGGSFIGSDGFDTNGLSALGKGAGHGVIANGGATGNAIRIGTGHAAFVGGNPAASVAFTNTATPTNILKAWARVFIDTGALSIVSGFNVSAATAINMAVGEYSITLAAGVTLATRAVVSQAMNWPDYSQTVDIAGAPSSTVVTLKAYSGGVAVNLGAADIWTFVIFVYGPQ